MKFSWTYSESIADLEGPKQSLVMTGGARVVDWILCVVSAIPNRMFLNN